MCLLLAMLSPDLLTTIVRLVATRKTASWNSLLALENVKDVAQNIVAMISTCRTMRDQVDSAVWQLLIGINFRAAAEAKYVNRQSIAACRSQIRTVLDKRERHGAQTALAALPGDEVVLKSVDNAYTRSPVVQFTLPSEQELNSIDVPGRPPHELVLKVGCVLDAELRPTKYLANPNSNPYVAWGDLEYAQVTLLSVQASNSTLKCRIITGTHAGKCILIPRTTVDSYQRIDGRPFVLRRMQYPVRVYVARPPWAAPWIRRDLAFIRCAATPDELHTAYCIRCATAYVEPAAEPTGSYPNTRPASPASDAGFCNCAVRAPSGSFRSYTCTSIRATTSPARRPCRCTSSPSGTLITCRARPRITSSRTSFSSTRRGSTPS